MSYEYDEYDFSYEEPPKRLLRSAVVKLIEAHREAELLAMRMAMREQEKKMAEQKARWAQRIDDGVTKPKRTRR